jgi:predicted acylesterase/phospholipase RssA
LNLDSSLPDLRRPWLRELQAMELTLMRAVVEDPAFLAPHDESALRWALSLARISKVNVLASEGTPTLVDIDHATNTYRERLHRMLEPFVTAERVISKDGVRGSVARVRELVAAERKSLLQLFGARMPYRSLDRATRKRPLALVMGGGGGTGYVYVGAMAVLDEAGLVPSLIAGTSMGSILGAFRARIKGLDLSNIRGLLARLSWKKVFRLFETGSRFGLPATLKLYLREVIGQEFEREGGGFLTLNELEIPLRVTIAGLVEGPPEKKRELVDKYAHLLDGVEHAGALRTRAGSIARALGEFTKQPVRAIYVGGDELTKSFDVLDAIGFSSAVPGIIHYDILRDDPRMVELAEALMKREGVFRFVDGGLADNLPAREAWRSIQAGAVGDRDPFVLAFDAFAPQLTTRHLLFLPLMRIAAENSRTGREVAHLTVTFKNVLSPLAVVPTPNDFVRAMDNGKKELEPHVAVIRKMVGPIPDPPGVLGDGG